MVLITQRIGSKETASASTSDWINQVQGRTIYAYDLSTLRKQEEQSFTKEDFEVALKKVCRKVK
jgi:hypothetical protein